MREPDEEGEPHETFAHHPSFKAIAIATLVVVVLIAVAMPFLIRFASNSASNSNQVAIGNEVAACRAQANALVQNARDQIAILQIRVTRAAVERDTAQLTAILNESVAVERNLNDANASYRQALDDSVHDQAKFLTRCKGGTP